MAAAAAGLRRLGVGRGDRVVAMVPNIPEAVVALLACASIGAIWSSCSPDFGARGLIDRFAQISPKVLIAVDGYTYGGKPFDRREVVDELRAELPTLERTVLIPYLDPDATADGPGEMPWADLLAGPAEPLTFEAVPFDHPLWVLYSSGTTGLPKAIVHGHGGVVLEHAKAIGLQFDIRDGDRMFWYTTTGWMMWNFLVGSMLVGGVPVLYDGSPGYPEPRRPVGAGGARPGEPVRHERRVPRRVPEGRHPAGRDQRPVAPRGDRVDRLAARGRDLRLGLRRGQARRLARPR